ncbi:hypothetical protein [Paenibacillus chitinolyticus]|nr:hypothetical protein [Paenibacillus chitinolyticus]
MQIILTIPVTIPITVPLLRAEAQAAVATMVEARPLLVTEAQP